MDLRRTPPNAGYYYEFNIGLRSINDGESPSYCTGDTRILFSIKFIATTQLNVKPKK